MTVDKDDVNDRSQSGIVCTCSKCRQQFILTADRDHVKGESTCIQTSSCDSGGLYDMVIECPYCGHNHSMM
jgi:hypothetical protein